MYGEYSTICFVFSLCYQCFDVMKGAPSGKRSWTRSGSWTTWARAAVPDSEFRVIAAVKECRLIFLFGLFPVVSCRLSSVSGRAVRIAAREE
jgi:hypothetical protein